MASGTHEFETLTSISIKMRMNKAAATFVAIGFGIIPVKAAVILQDNFPTNGSLVGTTPSVGVAWANNSGTANTLLVTGGQLIIDDNVTEDAYSNFSSSQTGDVYVSFTLNGSALDVSGSAAGAYFASFMNSSNYVGKLFALSDTATTFKLGVVAGTDPAPTATSVVLTTGISYHIVLKFTQNGASDTVSLWINPTSEASTSITSTAADAATNVTGWGFRQTTATGDYAIDNLVAGTSFSEVVTVPEPSSLALTALGAAFLLYRRKRKA